ncbi:tRNA(Ile)-lysidine synthetase [Psychromonas sp. CNPT3]|uniref:tRNA lysidine(34) synthetase TilS n=1 Tax=Psychromonas sp. CNPT3 TaxID=314282 RepID=UPI00006E5847|nr:tRNA lysidine(34) synthetase TilS [Psychromonas sp. CNPT3]AGH81971.1 tRNA(Ile)-lysidine synthetase [Psychromonas sp. CNPT3]
MKDCDLLPYLQAQLKTLAPQCDNFKIALSGGMDSVVLLHLFSRLHNGKVMAHHVHHGLSAHADDWLLFCSTLCKALNVDFCATRVHLDKKNRSSLEAVAREHRYKALQENASVTTCLVTAHHQDDQLESILLALKRGAGLTGLQGVLATQKLPKGMLIRPLLDVSRQQIEDYAALFSLAWIEDESNQDQRFDRNFIRHSITPLLKARWPSIAKTAARSALHCQAQQTLIDELTEVDFKLCIRRLLNDAVLNISALKALTATRRSNVLRQWFKSVELAYPSTKQLIALWHDIALCDEGACPKMNFKSMSVRRYQDDLYFVDEQKMQIEKEVCVWKGEDILFLCAGKLQIKISANAGFTAKQHCVEIRFRQHLPASLSCQPIHRYASRSIKKLLHEYNLPPWLRAQVPFIFIDGELYAALGLWQCQMQKICLTTDETLSLSFV